MENLTERIIPITDLRRNFGEISRRLVWADSLILTRSGRPFALLKILPKEKRKLLLSTCGAWKNTELDDDRLWAKVAKKKSRPTSVIL